MIFKFLNKIYKNILIIIMILFILKNSVFGKNHTDEDLGPLTDQIYSLKNDFNKSILDLSVPRSKTSQNVDTILVDLLNHVNFIEYSIIEEDFESAAYALDFIIYAITEISSNLPSETKIDLSSVDFDNLDEYEKEIMTNILIDINQKKINLIKNVMNYSIILKKKNIDTFSTISNINNFSLGFKELNADLIHVELDFSSIETLDFNQLEDVMQNLEEINIEDMTNQIEDSIKESAELIEEVVGEVADAVAITASQVMDEINSALGTNMTVEVYAWLYGVEGVTGAMSFSDAVDIFNEQFGTDLTEEEAAIGAAYDVCWLYGLCQ